MKILCLNGITKSLCLTAVFIASSGIEPTLASAVSLKGSLQHDLKLQGVITLTPTRAPTTPAPPKTEQEAEERPKHVIWPSHSAVPEKLQFVLAIAWVLLMATTPFIVPSLDQKPVSTAQMIVGVVMLLVLFGGLYLFTNVIIFQSIHFDDNRPLTIIECIYFMSQVITTVGYGDITPAKTRGQIFVALYVLGAVFVIAMLVGQVVDHFTTVLQKKRDEMWGMQLGKRATSVTVYELLHPEKPSLVSLIGSFAGFLLIDIVWIAFFHFYPGENKTFFEAFYMSLVTLTTVGFGAVTPVTEGGMIFNAFFMIIGSATIVSVIGNFTTYVRQLDDYQVFSSDVTTAAAEQLRTIVSNRDEVTELEFLRFIIHYDGLLPESEFNGILAVFKGLNPRDGKVSFKAVEEAMNNAKSPMLRQETPESSADKHEDGKKAQPASCCIS